VEVYEGIRRYPTVYYYHHGRRAYRSLPFAFRMIGGMAGALRWGCQRTTISTSSRTDRARGCLEDLLAGELRGHEHQATVYDE
jgi:hypothetical protein